MKVRTIKKLIAIGLTAYAVCRMAHGEWNEASAFILLGMMFNSI